MTGIATLLLLATLPQSTPAVSQPFRERFGTCAFWMELKERAVKETLAGPSRTELELLPALSSERLQISTAT